MKHEHDKEKKNTTQYSKTTFNICCLATICLSLSKNRFGVSDAKKWVEYLLLTITTCAIAKNSV